LSTAEKEEVRTSRLRVRFFRAAWRMESVPVMAGSMIDFEGVEPDEASFGSGYEPMRGRER